MVNTTVDNPVGTDGFSFIEFSSANPEVLHELFSKLGFTHVANHKQKVVELWQQNNIYFVINNEQIGRAHV